MRVAKIALGVASFIVASLTSTLTLLMGVSRLVNAPAGVESGLWAAVFAAVVGSAGAILLFFKPYAAAITLGLAAGLTITVIPPENGLPAALYAVSAFLALMAHFAGGRVARVSNSRQRTGT